MPICPNCNQEFTIPIDHVGRVFTYCSTKCRYLHWYSTNHEVVKNYSKKYYQTHPRVKQQYLRTCEICHKEFSHKRKSTKYCSKSCYARAETINKHVIRTTYSIPDKQPIDSAKACKIVQCDRSVEWFKTVMDRHPLFTQYQEQIIGNIRHLNKLMHTHDPMVYAKPSVIVAVAIQITLYQLIPKIVIAELIFGTGNTISMLALIRRLGIPNPVLKHLVRPK